MLNLNVEQWAAGGPTSVQPAKFPTNTAALERNNSANSLTHQERDRNTKFRDRTKLTPVAITKPTKAAWIGGMAVAAAANVPHSVAALTKATARYAIRPVP